MAGVDLESGGREGGGLRALVLLLRASEAGRRVDLRAAEETVARAQRDLVRAIAEEQRLSGAAVAGLDPGRGPREVVGAGALQRREAWRERLRRARDAAVARRVAAQETLLRAGTAREHARSLAAQAIGRRQAAVAELERRRREVERRRTRREEGAVADALRWRSRLR